MKRMAWILVFAAIFTTHLFGAEEVSGTRSVTDLLKRNVVIPTTVNRIVPLGPGALRLIVYLGVLNRVVGREDMESRMAKDPFLRPYASALDDVFFRLPVVSPGGPGKLPNFESLIMSRPDVVFTVGMDPRQVENIQNRISVPVVALSFGEIGVWGEEVQRSLTLLGEILNRQERAKAVNAFIKSEEKALGKRAKPGGKKRPVVYFGGISFKGAHGITSTQADYVPGRMVNALNVAARVGKGGQLFVDREQVLGWDPDIIFIDSGSRAVLARDFNNNREFYRLFKAVRSGNVYALFPYNYYNTNIELALLNAWYIGRCLYPDRFGDVDMHAEVRRILTFFTGMKRPVIENMVLGKVVFPESGPVKWLAEKRKSRGAKP